MTYKERDWIPFSKLVKENTHFNPCPRCGGQVMQARDMMIPRLADNPKCQKCFIRFKPRKKWHLFKGFEMIGIISGCPYLDLDTKECRTNEGKTSKHLSDQDLKSCCQSENESWRKCRLYKNKITPSGGIIFTGRTVW